MSRLFYLNGTATRFVRGSYDPSMEFPNFAAYESK